MSRARAFIPWFENLNKVYQLAIIGAAFLGFLYSTLTVGWNFWVAVMDYRIKLHVAPVAEMVEYNLKASGQWDKFLEEKAKAERDKHIRDGQQATAGAARLIPFIID